MTAEELGLAGVRMITLGVETIGGWLAVLLLALAVGYLLTAIPRRKR